MFNHVASGLGFVPRCVVSRPILLERMHGFVKRHHERLLSFNPGAPRHFLSLSRVFTAAFTNDHPPLTSEAQKPEEEGT